MKLTQLHWYCDWQLLYITELVLHDRYAILNTQAYQSSFLACVLVIIVDNTVYSISTLFILCLQEEQRAKAKKAREDLRSFLESHKKMHSSVRWRRACEMFDSDPMWEAVHERDRKDVFEDVVFFLAKKEKEEEKEQRAHNRKLMLQVYNTMSSITYRTTWAEVSHCTK